MVKTVLKLVMISMIFLIVTYGYGITSPPKNTPIWNGVTTVEIIETKDVIGRKVFEITSPSQLAWLAT